ncbi:MAG: acetyl-CoA C-acyltransferase [Thermoleophilaceae bacterium]
MPEAVIVDAVRSPIGRAFKGSLVGIRPDDLGAYIVDSLLDRNPEVDPKSVDDVIVGCGLTQGEQGYNIGRAIAMLSRLPVQVTGATVARYCASSLNAIAIGADAIKAGNSDTYIAGGVEHVSRVGMWSENGLPQLFDALQAQAPEEMKENLPMPDWKNPKLNGQDGRPDLYIEMGQTAENVAEKYDVSREDMDHYAQRSQELAVKSQEDGFFDREIVAVEFDGTSVSKDDGPRASSTYEKLAELKPAFREGGKVTAGNSCPLNDGAAAVLLTSAEKAKELGLKPKARVLGWATGGLEPEIMGVAPIEAIGNVLKKVGMTIDDIDVVELNEAFAAQVIPIMAECNIPLEKLNTHGGAIALGHPFGMTGARIMTTLLNVMETDDKQIGLETMCVAGGQGFAMVVERLN